MMGKPKETDDLNLWKLRETKLIAGKLNWIEVGLLPFVSFNNTLNVTNDCRILQKEEFFFFNLVANNHIKSFINYKMFNV